jgi:hypothetical protein
MARKKAVEVTPDRIMQVLTGEFAEPEQWHYLSFAGDVFLGAAIVKAHGIVHASLVCHGLGINPGGQVLGAPIPDDKLPAKQYLNRLLTREDIQEFWPDAKTIREWDEEERVS